MMNYLKIVGIGLLAMVVIILVILLVGWIYSKIFGKKVINNPRPQEPEVINNNNDYFPEDDDEPLDDSYYNYQRQYKNANGQIVQPVNSNYSNSPIFNQAQQNKEIDEEDYQDNRKNDADGFGSFNYDD